MTNANTICSWSNVQFDPDNPYYRKVEVERVTPKQKLRYKTEGVICPNCGRHLVPRRHPNSFHTWLIPRHKKEA